ncbi:hypothetical protein B0T09DRAFT_385319 [Sordaria sp. MPI-SDFR-AT-0083]|nr:hypothetical protein B0T09DRAFT_385319 [Sordaria sp. MPI-SDFR-AT-0083]
MDTTKEVVQKLAKLNIEPSVRAQSQQQPSFTPERTSSLSHSNPLGLSLNASRQTDQSSRTPFGPASQAGLQAQSTKLEVFVATLNTLVGPNGSHNIPLRKPFKTISSNIANGLARGAKTTNNGHKTISGGITKFRDKMRMGVDKILRREPSTGPKRWLKEKDRRNDRSLTRTQRGGTISEGLKKRLGLKREGATLGVIKEEEVVEEVVVVVEEDKEKEIKMVKDVKMEDSTRIDEDKLMEG